MDDIYTLSDPYFAFTNTGDIMLKGTVKWFDEKKGYGFITGEDGKDVFVHHTGIQGQGFKILVNDQTVEYELKDGPKGLQAFNVKKTEQS